MYEYEPARKLRKIIAQTLKSFPLIWSSSFIPETYALDMFDLSKSEWDLNEEW